MFVARHLHAPSKSTAVVPFGENPFMAVIIKYVVVRDGKEDMIFTSKKEADAYDKMLDIAERLNDFLQAAEVDIAEDKLDELAFFMAQHREPIGKLLRGGQVKAPVKAEDVQQTPTVAASKTGDASKRGRAAKTKAVA
jgi:dsDNA-binding SOS-regulon protein